MKRKSKPKKPMTSKKNEKRGKQKPAKRNGRDQRGEREHKGHRERLIRYRLEEAARLAHSDVTKAFRSDVWRQGIGQLAGMKVFPKPFFSGFGGGGAGSASLVGAQWTQIGPAPLRQTFVSGPAPVAGRIYDIATVAI